MAAPSSPPARDDAGGRPKRADIFGPVKAYRDLGDLTDPGNPPTPGQPPPFRGGGDPWAAFGYLVSGVAVYGALGWALGHWLHAPVLTAVGIVFGAALGLYLVFNRFARFGVPAVPESQTRQPGTPTVHDQPSTDAPPQDPRADREGRGEPAE
jgi:hypothetical protein